MRITAIISILVMALLLGSVAFVGADPVLAAKGGPNKGEPTLKISGSTGSAGGTVLFVEGTDYASNVGISLAMAQRWQEAIVELRNAVALAERDGGIRNTNLPIQFTGQFSIFR